jgi:hypothetical protein
MKAELVLGNLKREREALNNKLERLETALGKEWQDVDQEYLCTQQYNAMCLYAHILDERISDIEFKLDAKKAEKEAESHETSHDDAFMYNKNVDPDSYKNYDNTCCKEKCCQDDCVDTFVNILRDVFGDDLETILRFISDN